MGRGVGGGAGGESGGKKAKRMEDGDDGEDAGEQSVKLLELPQIMPPPPCLFLQVWLFELFCIVLRLMFVVGKGYYSSG
jgi:hypothetical protein